MDAVQKCLCCPAREVLPPVVALRVGCGWDEARTTDENHTRLLAPADALAGVI